MPGPIPKRSDQRRRRNKSNAVETVSMEGAVKAPPLNIDLPHPLAIDLYNSLIHSGQSRYYEPSDWQRARLMCEMLSRTLSGGGRPSSVMYATIQADMAALMVCESDRRRMRLEVERGDADTSEEDAKVAQMAAYRRAADG